MEVHPAVPARGGAGRVRAGAHGPALGGPVLEDVYFGAGGGLVNQIWKGSVFSVVSMPILATKLLKVHVQVLHD